MRRDSTLLVCLVALASPTLTQAQSIVVHLNTLQVKQANPDGQQFRCVQPYSVAKCESQIALLQTPLRKYDADRLGKWTWILVHSEDWGQLTSQLHLNSASPAFSHLKLRQTFLDESLLVANPRRQLELMTKWNLPLDKLLDFAVSHELGHALWQEKDEIKAERFAQLLRKNVGTVCGITKQQDLRAALH